MLWLEKTLFNKKASHNTAVMTGNDTFQQKSITQYRKTLITQPKHDILLKYAQVKPLKDGTAKALLHGFIEILNESSCQPNKLWVSEGRELTLCKNGYNNN